MSVVCQTTYPEQGMIKAEWASLLTVDVTGQAAQLGRYPCKSVQVTGTFGGATLVLEGSNDGTTYFTLKDPTGGSDGTDADVSFTAAGLKEVNPNTAFVRPRLSVVGSGADLKVVIIGA